MNRAQALVIPAEAGIQGHRRAEVRAGGATMSDYVICINNEGNPASLIVGKVYLQATRADRCYLIIISDESGSATIRGSVTETSSVSVTSRPNGAL